MRTLVLGLGNILLRDEGLGIVALRHLMQEYHFPEDVLLFDGGTGAFFLLPYLEEAQRVLLLDAISAGKEPGTIVAGSLRDFSPPLLEKISLHEVSLLDLLAILQLRGKNFEDFYILGMEPEDLSVGMELSLPVKRALPLLIEQALKKLREWGIPYSPRESTPK